MPIREYACKCKNCPTKIEIIESVYAPPATKCPNCGRDSLEKQISTPNFILKGKGFYKPSKGE